MIENFIGCMIKALQTENGKEYLSHSFSQFLQNSSIIHQLSCPHSHQQNGKAERKHKNLIEIGLALLATISLPLILG